MGLEIFDSVYIVNINVFVFYVLGSSLGSNGALWLYK